MPVPTTLSSREFNQDVGRAKKAALEGPVVVTDRGRPTHVLLSYEAYEHMQAARPTIDEMLGMPGYEEIEFEPVRTGAITRPVDL